MTKKRKILANSISILLFIISILILIAISWFKQTFSNVTIDELIFHLKVPLTGSNTGFIFNYFNYAKDYLIFLFLIVCGLIIYHSNKFNHTYNYKIKINFFKLKKNICIKIKDDRKHILIINIAIFILSIIYALLTLNIQQYIKNNLNTSTIFEEYYVNPKEVNIQFPEQKRNLIYIFLESMESTYSNLQVQGISSSNLIPNLEKLAKENTHFSNNNQLGGATQVTGSGWTIAALVAQTSGIPLKVAIDGNSLDKFSQFLPGAYALGDILQKEGYKQYFMIGSKSEFGGRKNYFEQHGNYEIFDYNTAITQEKISEDYFVWWGYEDEKLYTYAQEKLLEISKQDEPFNFTMLTADTHFLEGYNDETCELIHQNSFANSVACADIKIYNFINWIKQQDFYENTTIIISGDHLLMGNYLYPVEYSNERHIYNVIINSPVKTDNTTNRNFTPLDMFPTTLASLGAKIEGERLGLGTNLFSSKPTLSEELGFEKFNYELSLKSNYYNETILYE